MKARTLEGCWLVVAAGLLLGFQNIPAWSDEPDAAAQPGFQVSGEIALSALQALGDGHLQKMADSMRLLATGEGARSADWEAIRGPYAELASLNVEALNWFALPDGSYWSLQHGKEPGNLARRAYFPRVLAGETVLGELVYSTATGKPVAIVAVPVIGADGATVGVFGASVYLEQLSATIREELGAGAGMIFYSCDANGVVALNWDRELIFYEPMKSGDPALAEAFEQMLAAQEGVLAYRFRDAERQVAFRKSPVTGWWYAFGIVQ